MEERPRLRARPGDTGRLEQREIFEAQPTHKTLRRESRSDGETGRTGTGKAENNAGPRGRCQRLAPLCADSIMARSTDALQRRGRRYVCSPSFSPSPNPPSRRALWSASNSRSCVPSLPHLQRPRSATSRARAHAPQKVRPTADLQHVRPQGGSLRQGLRPCTPSTAVKSTLDRGSPDTHCSTARYLPRGLDAESAGAARRRAIAPRSRALQVKPSTFHSNGVLR